MESFFASFMVSLISLSVCAVPCNFPVKWRAGQWLLQEVFPVNNTNLLLTYKDQYGVISYSTSPDIEKRRFTCDDFQVSGNHTYYVQKVANEGVLLCVDDIQTANVILHREIKHEASSGTASVSDCFTPLSRLDVYDVLRPYDTPTSAEFYPKRISYPFETMNYRVKYTIPNGTEECAKNKNSVLVVSSQYITILCCKFQNYPNLPLTGVIYYVSAIDPRELGENDDANGKILIMEWFSKSITNNRTYCVRYKKLPDNGIQMSFDLTSGEPGNKLQCRKGHRYDDYGVIEGRQYFTMMFIYDSALMSTQSLSTTKRATVLPSQSTTTERPVTRHVELTLATEYDKIANKDNFRDEVISVLQNTMGVDNNRISNPQIMTDKADPANTLLSFDLDDGIPNSDFVLNKLVKLVNEKRYAIKTTESTVAVKKNSVYSWKDGNCPDRPCTSGLRCVSVDSAWSCAARSPMESSGKDSKTTYIAIGAAVGVLLIVVGVGIIVWRLRRNRNKGSDTDDSEMTYTNSYSNSRSLEALDRELYNTITKKPKAFHEKSFSSLDKDEDYGEKTGIHL